MHLIAHLTVDFVWFLEMLPIVQQYYADHDERLMVASGDLTQVDYDHWRTVRAAFNRKLIESPPLRTPLGCQIAAEWTQQDSKNEYRVLPLGRRHYKEYAHIAAWMLDQYEAKPPAGTEVSHLCHTPSCVCGEHLWAESRAENLDRNKCKGWTWIRSVSAQTTVHSSAVSCFHPM